MEQKENKMGTMSEGRLLLSMSLPMMMSMLVQALYNIVDSIFVSRIGLDSGVLVQNGSEMITQGEAALTAVSLAFPLQSLLIAIGAGTAVGVNALVSRALGERNGERANAIANNGVFVFFLSYIVCAVLGFVAVKPFYRLMTTPDQAEIFNYGVDYLSIVMIGSIGLFTQFIFERLLQSTGRTMYTMISQSTGAIINLILDPIMIFGLFGFPEMGVRGAALATIIGQIGAGIEAFIWNKTKNPELKVSIKGFRPDRKIIGNIYRIGVPSIIMQSIGSVMTTGMNTILMELSSTSAAVFGVYFKLQSFFFMPVFGLNNGLIPIISFNFGAKNRKRMVNTLKYGYIIAFILLLFGFVTFEFFPGFLFGFFDASETMLEIGIPALRIIGIHFLIAWFCIVTGSLFQAIGRASYSLYVSVARQLVVLLPAAWILAKIGGVSLIWWSFPIAEIMSLLISVVCMRKAFKTDMNI